MLTTTCEMPQDAYKGYYAVPTVNAQGGTHDIIRAVCIAAKELRFPVIPTHYVDTGAYSGHDWFYETAEWMATKVSVSVAIHLDHGNSFEHCMEVLKLGFTSIMFDGSALPVKENVAAIETVARVCRSFGISLKAEIRELYRLDDRGNKMGTPNIADPDMMRQYLKFRHPGSLAIGIDNAHGFHNGPVDIRAGMLEECREFTDIPFALHGCMGMGEELAKRSTDNGAARINFGIQVRYQHVNYLKEGLAEGKGRGHAWRLSQYAELRLREDAKDIIRLAGPQEKARLRSEINRRKRKVKCDIDFTKTFYGGFC